MEASTNQDMVAMPHIGDGMPKFKSVTTQDSIILRLIILATG